MFTFIEMEFLKLKRSKIFLLSLLGAILPPLLMFIAVTSFDEGQTFEALFTNVNMYMSAMFAVLIFAIIISYLFGREYNEHTLKIMLTIPVSREKFLASKYLMFLVWIVILTVVTSISTLVFGFAAGLDGFSLRIFADGFTQLLYANILLFLSFSPFVFVSLFITNMVPAMVGGAGLALVNLMVYGQNWAPFVPWVCPYLIASDKIAEYSTSITVSYGVILATFVIGLAISYIYFTKTDVSI
ncbi:ABC transporter permease [Methanobrevibacter sp.]|uniref:ABC transporter permease n=1 Tax=Methanobrevibacter sp. TaxID=66852 RepID=UPI00388D9D3B